MLLGDVTQHTDALKRQSCCTQAVDRVDDAVAAQHKPSAASAKRHSTTMRKADSFCRIDCQLVKHVEGENLLKECIKEVKAAAAGTTKSEPVVSYVAGLCSYLCGEQIWDAATWKRCCTEHFAGICPQEADAIGTSFRGACIKKWKDAVVDTWGADLDPDLKTACDIEFSLAYGGKLLLHNTRLFLKCGRRYGICGKNGVGKSTLMRNVDNGKIEGLDPDLCAVFVESHADADPDEAKPVLKWVCSRPRLIERNVADEASALELLQSVGFSDELLGAPVASLSGGWRMKLTLVVAALMDADILLLDEPTNHLDKKSVEWLVAYLTSTRACCMIVSHDTAFLDAVCTDIIHYEGKKLVRYRGNLSEFVAKVPAAAAYYRLEESSTRYAFPAPGRLEGIATSTKAIVRLDGATFTWPGRDVPTLVDASCKITLGSRICVLGANGAGKSTLIKLVVGENGPDNGECLWRHHNLRIAYVAQHSFHHIEQHLERSPCEYLQWRFGKYIDEEQLQTKLAEMKRVQAQEDTSSLPPVRPLPHTFEKIMGRREKNNVIEYEVKWWDRAEKHNLHIDKERLERTGHAKEVLMFDMLVAARAAGLDLINVTVSELQAHLDEFGLPQEYGTYGKVRGLSGGQKVKLVLAAAMWNRPHLLILDEPTNFLDRDSLGALSNAIRDFGGGVVMISHAEEFYKPLCSEKWLVEGGVLTIDGEAADKKLKIGKKKREAKAKEVVKSTGSTNEELKYANPKDFWGKTLSKKDIRTWAKKVAKRDYAAMRVLLKVPKGKQMPNMPELGDGTES